MLIWLRGQECPQEERNLSPWLLDYLELKARCVQLKGSLGNKQGGQTADPKQWLKMQPRRLMVCNKQSPPKKPGHTSNQHSLSRNGLEPKATEISSHHVKPEALKTTSRPSGILLLTPGPFAPASPLGRHFAHFGSKIPVVPVGSRDRGWCPNLRGRSS